MKRKADFVTNSSTCSFIMIGFPIPDDGTTIETLIERAMTKEDFERRLVDYDQEDIDGDLLDLFQHFCEENDVQIITNEDDFDLPVGCRFFIGEKLARWEEAEGANQIQSTIKELAEWERDIKDLFKFEVDAKIITGTESC